jgi:hypothetical protein
MADEVRAQTNPPAEQQPTSNSNDNISLKTVPETGVTTQLQTYDDADEYPEGGTQAWLVVVGAWCAMIPSMGLLNTLGVLQAWVSEHQLESYTESNIGWIFSAYAFFLYIFGVQVGENRTPERI